MQIFPTLPPQTTPNSSYLHICALHMKILKYISIKCSANSKFLSLAFKALEN